MPAPRARRIIELGTALGYTACWFANGAPDAHIDTIDFDPEHVRLARANIEAAGFSKRVTLHEGAFDDVLTGNTYYRSFRQRNFSTNINDDFDPTSPIVPGNTQGLNVQDNTTTQGYGAGLQFSHLGKLAGFDNRFTIGGSADLGQSYFEENQQDANFAPDRSRSCSRIP